MRRIARRITPAEGIAALALFVVLGGGAYAQSGADITGRDIANNSVGGKDVKQNSLAGGDLKNGSITGEDVRNDSLTGDDVDESTLELPTGPGGANGSVGPKGDTGPVGPRGEAGERGPAGSQGQTGPQGTAAAPRTFRVERASSTLTIPAGNVGGTLTASCDAGEVATGGGGDSDGNGIDLRKSEPTPSTDNAIPTGWEVDFINEATVTFTDIPIRAYAICASSP